MAVIIVVGLSNIPQTLKHKLLHGRFRLKLQPAALPHVLLEGSWKS